MKIFNKNSIKRNTTMRTINISTRGQSFAHASGFIANPFCLLAALVLVLIVPLQAKAMVVSLSPADIQSFTQITPSGGALNPFTIKTSETAEGAGFTTLWSSAVVGASSADIGTGNSYDWTGADTFSLNIVNHNESSWFFMVSVSDGSTTKTSGAPLSLMNDNMPVLFSVDLAGLNVAAINSVFMTVSEILPIGGIDRTAEYLITTVPVPAAAWMFGSSLGLLIWMRRRLPTSVAA